MKIHEKYLTEQEPKWKQLVSKPKGMKTFRPEDKHWKNLKRDVMKALELAQKEYEGKYPIHSKENFESAIASLQDFQMRLDMGTGIVKFKKSK